MCSVNERQRTMFYSERHLGGSIGHLIEVYLIIKEKNSRGYLNRIYKSVVIVGLCLKLMLNSASSLYQHVFEDLAIKEDLAVKRRLGNTFINLLLNGRNISLNLDKIYFMA